MAFKWISCPTCGRDVRSTRDSCPNCGLVLREGSIEGEDALESGLRPGRREIEQTRREERARAGGRLGPPPPPPLQRDADRFEDVPDVEFLGRVGVVGTVDNISWWVAFKIAIAILIVSIAASAIAWFVIKGALLTTDQ